MTKAIDIDALTAPLDEENPCGEALEDFVFDPDYAEVDRLSQGKEEQVMGDEVIEAEEPDWREVLDKSLNLFERVRSLRLAVLITKALCVREGLGGMREGLELVHSLMEKYWDDVEPLIDDGDATERLHTVGELATGPGLIRLVREAEFVSSPAVGRYTVRDYLVASDRLKPKADEEPATLTSINQALMDCELDQLKETLENIQQSIELIGQIETLFNKSVSSQFLIDLDPMTKVLADLRPPIQEVLGRRGIAVEDVSESGKASDSAQPPGLTGSSEIASREDVVRMLDRMTEYYNRHEPSSPVPLLLQRAKRLVSADFMAIIKDVASDGLQQADLLVGSKDED